MKFHDLHHASILQFHSLQFDFCDNFTWRKMTNFIDWRWIMLGSYLTFIAILLACTYAVYGRKTPKQTKVVTELLRIPGVPDIEAQSTRERKDLKPCFDWS